MVGFIVMFIAAIVCVPLAIRFSGPMPHVANHVPSQPIVVVPPPLDQPFIPSTADSLLAKLSATFMTLLMIWLFLNLVYVVPYAKDLKPAASALGSAG